MGAGFNRDRFVRTTCRGRSRLPQVSRTALQNAASVAALALTTEAMTTDAPAPGAGMDDRN